MASALAARSVAVFGTHRQAPRRPVVTVAAKPGLHPEWYEESKVTCNGEEVLVTSGTQPGYTVDIWSGNHPFYQGVTSMVVTDEGRVNRFKRRFAGLESIANVANLPAGRAEIEEKPKAGGKGGKGKGGKRK